MLIKTTKFAIGELAEKCRIVADEQDLQDDYEVTEQEVADAVLELMKMEREGTTIDTDKFSAKILKMLAGEGADAAVVQRDIAKDARANLSDKYHAIQKGARDLELLSESIGKLQAA